MDALKTVIGREIRERVRSGGFWIFAALGVAAVVGVLVIPGLVANASGTGARTVTIVSRDRTTVSLVREEMAAAGLPMLRITATSSEAHALEDLRHGRTAAVLVVPPLLGVQGERAILRTRTAPPADLSSLARTAIRSAALRSALPDPSVHPSQIGVESRMLSNQGSAKPTNQRLREGFVFLLLLFLALMQFSSYLAASVSDEKNSRITEVLLVSISSRVHMAGKVLAFGVLATIEGAMWVATAVVASRVFGSEHGVIAAGAAQLHARDLAYFAVFYVLGFVFFASLAAGLASLVSSVEDTSATSLPGNVLALVGYLLATVALGGSAARAVNVLSLTPPVSAFVMFARLFVGAVPAWQVGASIAGLLLAGVAVVLLAGRIYGRALLAYGQKPSLAFVKSILFPN